MRRSTALLLLPLAFLALFFAYPLWRTLEAAFQGLDAWQWATGDYVQARLWLAVVQATLSVLVTLALALPLAWHHHRRALPWSRVHLALHAAPFVLPVFVVINGMLELFGPTGWLHVATGFDLLGWLGPLGAVVLAHAYYNYGFAARILHAALERRPHRMEEAAQTLGATPRAAFLRTTGVLLAPSLLAVALLVWLFSFTSFGVVLFLPDAVAAGTHRIATLETLLYQQLGGVFPRFDRAAVLGTVQLVLNIAVLGAYFALRRREAQLPRDPPRAPAPATVRDRVGSGVALGVGLLPAAAVLVGGFRVRGTWTLEAWRALLDPDHPAHVTGFSMVRALGNSIAYAGLAAVLALALTLLLGYALRGGHRGWLRRVAEPFAMLPLGTSSVLLGFGYLLAFGAGSALDLRGLRIQLIIAHALIGFPFVARTFLPALQQHDRRMDEAAALLGARPRDVLLRIHWPLLQGPLLAAAGFAVAISLGDFGASLLLMRRDTMNLSVWIGEHEEAFDLLMHAQSVALSAVLMVLAALAYLGVERFRKAGVGH